MEASAIYAMGQSRQGSLDEKIEALTDGFFADMRKLRGDPDWKIGAGTADEARLAAASMATKYAEIFEQGESGRKRGRETRTPRSAEIYERLAASINDAPAKEKQRFLGDASFTVPASYDGVDELSRDVRKARSFGPGPGGAPRARSRAGSPHP